MKLFNHFFLGGNFLPILLEMKAWMSLYGRETVFRFITSVHRKTRLLFDTDLYCLPIRGDVICSDCDPQNPPLLSEGERQRERERERDPMERQNRRGCGRRLACLQWQQDVPIVSQWYPQKQQEPQGAGEEGGGSEGLFWEVALGGGGGGGCQLCLRTVRQQNPGQEYTHV